MPDFTWGPGSEPGPHALKAIMIATANSLSPKVTFVFIGLCEMGEYVLRDCRTLPEESLMGLWVAVQYSGELPSDAKVV